MYSVVSKQIIHNWLEQLSDSDEVDPLLIDIITQLVQNNDLNSEEILKQAISSLEEQYEDYDKSADG